MFPLLPCQLLNVFLFFLIFVFLFPCFRLSINLVTFIKLLQKKNIQASVCLRLLLDITNTRTTKGKNVSLFLKRTTINLSPSDINFFHLTTESILTKCIGLKCKISERIRQFKIRSEHRNMWSRNSTKSPKTTECP